MSARSPAPDPAGASRAAGSRAIRTAWAWVEGRLVRAPILALDGDDRLVPHRGEPVVDVPGLVLPGLVNAHTHLELGPLHFPAGLGLPAWVPLARAAPPGNVGEIVVAAIRGGAAAVGEVTNTGRSAPYIRAAGLGGRVFHEVVGIDQAALPVSPEGARPTPHGPHTAHPDVLRACAALPGPWTIHFDEDPAEAAFLFGEGPWPAFMARIGRDLGGYRFPRCSPARYLDELGVLSPRALLVHATCTRGEDLDVVARSGARVALCVRSNQALTGRLPDVPGLLARGVPLAVGTDSLASSPDLDLLAEGAALRRAFPEVAPATWLGALTEGGADALALPLGRIREGAAPGLLQVDVPDDDPLSALFDGTRRRRRWLACPSR